MEEQEILRKAFNKAKQNGWNSYGYEYIVLSYDKDSLPPTIIYTHDFAKAFWGMENSCCIRHGDTLEVDDDSNAYCGVCCDDENEPSHLIVGWQYHLQQMVLEENPIKYLEKFVS